MSLKNLSDSELVASFKDAVIDEQLSLASQIEHIAELDRRKLFYQYSSLRALLIHEFNLEEGAAERKIRAARLLIKFPEILPELRVGKLNLSLLELVMGCAHRETLGGVEISELLIAVSGLTVNAARRKVASLYPQGLDDLPHDRIKPLTDDLSEVSFVASQELLDQLDEIKGLLAHSHPGIKMSGLIKILADEYRKRHHPEVKTKSSTKPVDSPTATWVPGRVPSQPMIRALIRRDGYKCSYVDPKSGKACDSKFALQIDHRVPWATGGKTVLSNLRYLCRGHHARVSFLQFGESARFLVKPPA